MDSSEETDAFTIEYKKILQQLPAMLKPTEPIPLHLQNYIKPNDTSYSSNVSSSKHHKYPKSKRKRNRHKSRHHDNQSFTDSNQPITIIDDDPDYYPPLNAESFLKLNGHKHTHSDDESSCNLSHHSHHHSHPKRRRRSKSSSFYHSHSRKKRNNKSSKHHILSSSHHLKPEDDDIVTIQELQRINAMLSDQNTISAKKDAMVQTEEAKNESKCTQTEPEKIEIKNMKIKQLINKLTNELNDKSIKCEQMKEDYDGLEEELRTKNKELIEVRLQINGWKQQIEDERIYSTNLIKHLDEKSRNETLLRNELNQSQKQLESAHYKLQQFLIPNDANNKSVNCEITQLREHLIVCQQKCMDWKKKWKAQCFKIEQFESDKIMNEHRVDQQLNEYQKIIQDFRTMMKTNLSSVNANFEQLNEENIALKAENERLIYELGKIQENTFLLKTKNTKIEKRDNQITELTEKLTEFQENLEKSHLNGTMDKSVQCIEVKDEECNNLDGEFNKLSIEIYKLIINLKEKSFDIVNEYGLKSLTNSPRKMPNKNVKLLYKDTDDVDVTSIIINCKKRFNETKEILQNLVNCFDDFMYQQAEKQCDQCITQ